MSPRTARIALGGALVIAAIVLLIVVGGGGEGGKSSNASGKVPTIVIAHGKPVGGIEQLTYNEGERIRFRVSSDVAEEVHLHGYDVMKDVKAGGTVTFDVPATIEGVFDAELEGRSEQIAEITVNP